MVTKQVHITYINHVCWHRCLHSCLNSLVEIVGIFSETLQVGKKVFYWFA